MGQRYSLAGKALEGSGLKGGGIDDNTSLTKIRPTADFCEGPSLCGRSCPDIRSIHEDDPSKEYSSPFALKKIDNNTETSLFRNCENKVSDDDCKKGLTQKDKEFHAIIRSTTFDEGKKISITSELSKSATSLNTDNKLWEDDKHNVALSCIQADTKMSKTHTVKPENARLSENSCISNNSEDCDSKTVNSKHRKFKCILDNKTLPKCNNVGAMTKAQKMISKSKENLFCHETSDSKLKQKDAADTLSKSKSISNIMLGSVNENHFRTALSRLWQRKSTDKKKKCDDDWDDLDESNSQTFLRDASLRSVSFSRKTIFNTMKSKTLKARCSAQRYYNSEEQQSLTCNKDSADNNISDQNHGVLRSTDDDVIQIGNSRKEENIGRKTSNPRTVRGNGTPHAVRVLKATLRLVDIDDDDDDDKSFISITSDSKEMFSTCKDSEQRSDVTKKALTQNRKGSPIRNPGVIKTDSVLSSGHSEVPYTECTTEGTVACSCKSGSRCTNGLECVCNTGLKAGNNTEASEPASFQETRPRSDHIGLVRGRRVDQRKRFVSPERSALSDESLSDISLSSQHEKGRQSSCFSCNQYIEVTGSAMKTVRLEPEGFSQKVNSINFNKTGFSSCGSDCKSMSKNSADQISNRISRQASYDDFRWQLVRTSCNYSDKNNTKIHRNQSDATLQDFYTKGKLSADKKHLLNRTKSLHCLPKVDEANNCHILGKLEVFHFSGSVVNNEYIQDSKDLQNLLSTCTITVSDDCMSLGDGVDNNKIKVGLTRLDHNLIMGEIIEPVLVDGFDDKHYQEASKKFQPKQSVDSDDSVFVRSCNSVLNSELHIKCRHLDHNATEEYNNIINTDTTNSNAKTAINMNILNNDRPILIENKNDLKSKMWTRQHKPHSSIDTNVDTCSTALPSVSNFSDERPDCLEIDGSYGANNKSEINRDYRSSDETDNHLLSIPPVQSCSCASLKMISSAATSSETQRGEADVTGMKITNKDSNNKTSSGQIPEKASGPTHSLGSVNEPNFATASGHTLSLRSDCEPSLALVCGPIPGFEPTSNHAYNVSSKTEINPGLNHVSTLETSPQKPNNDTDSIEPDSGVCERSCNPAAIRLVLESLLQRELNRRAAADSTPANSPTSASSAPAAYPLAAASPTAFYQASNFQKATKGSDSANTSSINVTNSAPGTCIDYCNTGLTNPTQIITRRSISVVKHSNTKSLGNININHVRRSDRWGQAARSLADVVRMGVSAVHERSPTSPKSSNAIFGKFNQKSDITQNEVSQHQSGSSANSSDVTFNSNAATESTNITARNFIQQPNSLNSVMNIRKETPSQVPDFDKLDVDRSLNEFNRYDSGLGTSEKSAGKANTSNKDTNVFSSINSTSQNSEPISQTDSINKIWDSSSINSENYNNKETAWKYSQSLSSSFASSSTCSVKPVAMVYPRKIHGVRVLPPAPPAGRPSGNRASVMKPKITNRDNVLSPFYGNAYNIPALKSPRSSIIKSGRKSEKKHPREDQLSSDQDQVVTNRFFAALKHRNVTKEEIKESDEIISRVTDRVERLERAQREARMLKLRNDLSDARHRKSTYENGMMSGGLNGQAEKIQAEGCIEPKSRKIGGAELGKQSSHDPKSENSTTDYNEQAENTMKNESNINSKNEASNMERSVNYLARPHDIKSKSNGKCEKEISVLSTRNNNIAVDTNRPKYGNAAPCEHHKLSESSAIVEFGVLPGNVGGNRRNENNLNIYRKQKSEEMKSISIDDDEYNWISKAQEKDLLEGHEGVVTGPLKVVDVDQSGLYVEGKKEAEFEALVQTVRGSGKFRGVRKGLESIKKADASHKGVVDFEETLGYFP